MAMARNICSRAVTLHRLGPENATLTVHTRRGGAAAKAGHDLELRVTSWQAELDETRAELTADATSLRVVKATGGMQALGDEDKANIHQTIDDDVLRRQDIVVRPTAVDGDPLRGGPRGPDRGRAHPRRPNGPDRLRPRAPRGRAPPRTCHGHADALGHEA